jgi:hypothetical protein
MSANVYSVEDLLVGKAYRSRSLEGTILSAKKHPYPIWYEGCESYLVEVQPKGSIRVTYRTIAVKTTD